VIPKRASVQRSQYVDGAANDRGGRTIGERAGMTATGRKATEDKARGKPRKR